MGKGVSYAISLWFGDLHYEHQAAPLLDVLYADLFPHLHWYRH